MALAEVEVAAQHGIIEQQLHIVVFELIAAEGVGPLLLDVEVLARLLLYEETEVGGHQVDTSLQAELLADEGGLEDGLVGVEALLALIEEVSDDAADVLPLPLGILLELTAVEHGAAAEVEGLLGEVGPQRVLPGARATGTDHVVEGAAGIVAQEDGLGNSAREHHVEDVLQRTVAVLLETARQLTDIDEEVGLHNDEQRLQTGAPG